MSTPQENKAIVQRYLELNSGDDLDMLDALVAEDVALRYPAAPAPMRGRQTLKQSFAHWRASFPNQRLTVEDLIAEEDRVVALWTFEGTHHGEVAGIPATGKTVRYTGISAFRLRDGKMVEDRTEEDFLGLLRQIGAVPASGPG